MWNPNVSVYNTQPAWKTFSEVLGRVQERLMLAKNTRIFRLTLARLIERSPGFISSMPCGYRNKALLLVSAVLLVVLGHTWVSNKNNRGQHLIFSILSLTGSLKKSKKGILLAFMFN